MLSARVAFARNYRRRYLNHSSGVQNVKKHSTALRTDRDRIGLHTNDIVYLKQNMRPPLPRTI